MSYPGLKKQMILDSVGRKRRCPVDIHFDGQAAKRRSTCEVDFTSSGSIFTSSDSIKCSSSDSNSSVEERGITGTTMSNAPKTLIIQPPPPPRSISSALFGVTLTEFFVAMLKSRGYESRSIEMRPDLSERNLPEDQLRGYSSDIIAAVYESDTGLLQQLKSQNRRFDACNKFFESLLHKACRWSSREVVDFLLANGADPFLFDDHGRLPLHDACWRSQTDFLLVRTLLRLDPSMLRQVDSRGNTPLDYVRKKHHNVWCYFLYKCLDDFWPVQSDSENSSGSGSVSPL